MAAFLDPGAWGREFTTAIDGYSNMAGMWIVGEDMPQETNRITLSDQKDKWGLPVVDAHFDDHPNDVAMRNHAFGQGKAMYEAVGATRTFPTPPYPSTHNLGTNRMSANARDRVGHPTPGKSRGTTLVAMMPTRRQTTNSGSLTPVSSIVSSRA